MLKSKSKFNENDRPIIVLCRQQRHFQFSEKPQEKNTTKNNKTKKRTKNNKKIIIIIIINKTLFIDLKK